MAPLCILLLLILSTYAGDILSTAEDTYARAPRMTMFAIVFGDKLSLLCSAPRRDLLVGS